MVAGTTPVNTLRETSIVFAGTQTKTQLHLDTLTKTGDLHFISLGPSMGKTFSYLGSKAKFPTNLYI